MLGVVVLRAHLKEENMFVVLRYPRRCLKYPNVYSKISVFNCLKPFPNNCVTEKKKKLTFFRDFARTYDRSGSSENRPS